MLQFCLILFTNNRFLNLDTVIMSEKSHNSLKFVAVLLALLW